MSLNAQDEKHMQPSVETMVSFADVFLDLLSVGGKLAEDVNVALQQSLNCERTLRE